MYNTVKVKQYLYWPGQILRVPEVKVHRFKTVGT